MNLSGAHRAAVRECKKTAITACQLDNIEQYINNPAGTNKADSVNPGYKGKVVVRAGVIHINLTYLLTGNISRADIGLKDLRSFFKDHGIVANFTANPMKPDLRIHGASLSDIVLGLKICTCEDGLYIGGWGPNPNHPTWGNALLLSSTSPRSSWKTETVHEFFHKLGLKHRREGGIMDYVDPSKPDRRKFLPSERARIIALYQ